MRASPLRRRFLPQEFPTAQITRPSQPIQTQSFPAFALIVSQNIDDTLHHRIHAALSSVSDHVIFPNFNVALAKLEHMSCYFKDSITVRDVFFSSCNQLLPEINDDKSNEIRVFLGNHLLRSFIFLQTDSRQTAEQLNSLHLRQRQLMERLTWEQWLKGVRAFLFLYEQPRSTLENTFRCLDYFTKAMLQMRMPLPEQARSKLCPADLNRRFGRPVAEIWKIFCQPHDWKKFDGHSLRTQEQPINLNNFVVHNHELPSFSNSQAIALHRLVPTLIEIVSLILEKISTNPKTKQFGIKELEVSISFDSGHRILKQFFLNKGIFESDSTTRATLQHVFESILKNSVASEGKPNKSTLASFFAHWEDKKDVISSGLETTWTPIQTSDGFALSHSSEPGIAYLISHIEHIEVKPIRLCARAFSAEFEQLFTDNPSQIALEDISKLRRELLVQYGQHSEHFFTHVSFRRPCASHSFSSPSLSSSNLFNHAFQIRPPAVLRRPLPFFPEKDLNRKQMSQFQKNLLFLETIGNHTCYALIFPDDNYALWLCTLASTENEANANSHYMCLGFFDSLELLPEWMTYRTRRNYFA